MSFPLQFLAASLPGQGLGHEKKAQWALRLAENRHEIEIFYADSTLKVGIKQIGNWHKPDRHLQVNRLKLQKKFWQQPETDRKQTRKRQQ